MSMRQVVEADVTRLRKLLDDTNIIRLHLESEIESLKEELIHLKKNHENVSNISQKYLIQLNDDIETSSSRRKTYLIIVLT